MTHITSNIEVLQKKLNQMLIQDNDLMKVYSISTELDTWIVKYYKQQ